jgi:hypothetical protein
MPWHMHVLVKKKRKQLICPTNLKRNAISTSKLQLFFPDLDMLGLGVSNNGRYRKVDRRDETMSVIPLLLS